MAKTEKTERRGPTLVTVQTETPRKDHHRKIKEKETKVKNLKRREMCRIEANLISKAETRLRP